MRLHKYLSGYNSDAYLIYKRIDDYINNLDKEDSLDTNANSDIKKPLSALLYGVNGIMKNANANLLVNYAVKNGFLHNTKIASSFIKDGLIYIHDLSNHKLLSPYCFSFSTRNLIYYGLPYGQQPSRPPNRLLSFVNQSIDLVWALSTIFAGAISPYDFLIYFAYFALKEKASEEFMRELIQHYIYSVNRSTRAEGDSAFTNVNLYDEHLLDSLIDFENEVKALNAKYNTNITADEWRTFILDLQELYLEVFTRSEKLPFRFPVTTFQMLVGKNNTISDYARRLVIKYNRDGRFYLFLNYGDVKAICNCCRLISDLSAINSFGVARGQVGSHRVISLNLFGIYRKVLEINEKFDKELFLKYIDNVLYVAIGLLKAHRDLLAKLIDAGIIPFFAPSNRAANFEKGEWFSLKQFFSTVGVIGLWDVGEDIYFEDKGYHRNSVKGYELILELEKEILTHINKQLRGIPKEDGIFNLELVPAENASFVLSPFEYPLSNQYISLLDGSDFARRLRFSGELDKICSGGTITFLNIGHPLSEEEMNILLNMAIKYRAVYFTLNPVYYKCQQCGFVEMGYNKGKCLKCGGKLKAFTRVVGYFTPVDNWNIGKQKEFHKRRLAIRKNTMKKYQKQLQEG